MIPPTSAASPKAVRPGSARVVGGHAALVALASLTLATAAAAVPAASATTVQHFSYTGSAFGTTATVGSLVSSGRSAALSFGCTTDGNLHRTNSTAGVSAAPLARTGAVATTGDTYSSPVRSSTSAATANVSLLNGLVRATAVKAVSSTTRTTSGVARSASGTTLTGLVIGGRSLAANAAPNTRINLAGFGYVVVNEQVSRTNGLIVNALHLHVTTTNALAVKAGSTVIVSDAVSGLSGPVSGVIGGYSYGTAASIGSTVLSNSSFPEFLPCLGTGGVQRTNTGAAAHLGTSLTTGTIADTAQGNVTATAVSGETTSTVQTASLLNGAVSVTAVKADARVSTSGSTRIFTDTGSSIGSLKVLGRTVSTNVPANTTVPVLGVGTLYLHRVVRTSASIQVVMVELVLNTPSNGLPAGTHLRIGVAKLTTS